MPFRRLSLLPLLAISLAFSPCQAKEVRWRHLSSAAGDLPVPGTSTQQTSAVVVDLDRDGQFNPKPVTRSHYNDPTGGGESEGGTGGVAIPDGQKPYPTFTAAAWATGKPPVPVKVVSAEAALAHVMAEAGASLRRDPVDARIIAELKSLGKEGKVIKEEKEVGGIGAIKAGTPIVDADKDGIPDAWEAAHGLNPQDGADAVKVDPASGYLMIEVYANGLVGGK